jgi:hypothetical protein
MYHADSVAVRGFTLMTALFDALLALLQIPAVALQAIDSLIDPNSTGTECADGLFQGLDFPLKQFVGLTPITLKDKKNNYQDQ